MKINFDEVLRYLGYKNQPLDSKIVSLIEECHKELKELVCFKYTYRIFNMDKTNDGIVLKGSALIFRGEDISNHLLHSRQCAIMAVTLGLQVDRRINLYSKTDLTRGLILDACATSAVETACDEVQEEIKNKAAESGYYITDRFSPGYGDLPIRLQRDIGEALRLYETIGVSVNDSYLMAPRKSVTAIIGFQGILCNSAKHNCKSCNKPDCIYRR